MKRFLPLAALVISACSASIEEPGHSAPLMTLPRNVSAGEQHVISAVNDFSWSLFNQLVKAQKDSNLFSSPLSASMSLGMGLNGASGATYAQMRSALAFGNATDADINGSYKSLIALLRSLDNAVDLRVANSVWYDKRFTVKQSFIDINKSAFDADVNALDFQNTGSVGTINSWVKTATNGVIPTIIGQISADDRMFLINAIYFKGSWRAKFDPAQTIDQPFHGIAGDQAMKLMHRHGDVNALFRADLTAAELFYGDSAYSMVVLVPQGTNTVDNVAASLNATSWSAMLAQMHPVSVDVFLPKLQLAWEHVLNDDLIALGMRDAFTDSADFSRLSQEAVQISKVKQKAYVDINEEGTTAAAVTSTGFTATSAGPEVRVDRPFLFVIRERLTGTILFMGKIVRMP